MRPVQYGDTNYPSVNSRLQDVEPEDFGKNVTWHRSCYQDTVHPGKTEQARKRYEKSVSANDIQVLTDVHKGHPKSCSSPDQSVQCQSPTIHYTKSS